MTKDEALKKMQAVKSYMTSGNPIWSITEMGEAFDMAIEALEQPERKKGKWVVGKDGMIHCTACNEIPTSKIIDTVKTLYEISPFNMNFCPKCGADMRGKDNG